jgi:ParB/RepB/Spo0J family partition protein
MGNLEKNDQYPVDRIIIKNRYRTEKDDIESLAESIRDIGQLQPVVVDVSGKLIIGERRVLAIKHLGYKTIRAEIVHTVDQLERLIMERDENLERSDFTWADAARIEREIFNRRAAKDATWTQEKQAETRGISQQKVSMRLKLGEALEVLPELAELPTQDQAFKEYKRLEEEAGIRHMRSSIPDEVRNAPQWAKDHYIIGDAIEGLSGFKEEFDFAEVDPPYAIDLNKRKDRNAKPGNIEDYNEIKIEDYPIFLSALVRSTYQALKPDTFAIFWHGFQWYTYLFNTLIAEGFAVNAIPAIWYKGQAGQTAQPDIALGSSYEPFFIARKGKPRMARSGRSNVFDFKPVAPSKKIHTTERPFDMMVDILDTMLFPGSRIVVPFLGSGVTLRAAYKLGHTGIGWDLSYKHKDRFLRQVMKGEKDGDVDATE